MTAVEIQNLIDKYEYWDARASKVECNHFADEITIAYEYEKGHFVQYRFTGCYRSVFDHAKNYPKSGPAKDMTTGQIPCFFQDVKVSETTEEGQHFFVCNIDMFPLYIEIWSQDIQVYEANNNVSNDKNDWRYTGQDEYLMNVQLKFNKFDKSIRDHDHCEFCGEKFSEYDGTLHEGYCTLDNYHWICETCFHDFQDMFKWEVVEP